MKGLAHHGPLDTEFVDFFNQTMSGYKPTLEELPADQPDIHNQEQHEENQDDV